MRRNPGRRLGLAAGAVAALALAAAATVLVARPGPTAGARPTSPPSTTTPSTTTTSIVVEQLTLPTGTQEYATVRASIDEVVVRGTPPTGWDRSLTPVVGSADPEPPRSGLDAQRVRLPSETQPITGRYVARGGWVFTNPTSYQPPQPLVFGVVQRQGDWLEVRLPVRPNGTTGWLRARDVTVTTTTRSVQISLTERRLRVVDAGQVLMDVPAGIGRPATPTPTGEFTVTDIVPSADPAGGYGPVALALDGYSEVMDSFAGENGGDTPDATVPVLAIHGTNQPSSVGAARSNGCPRLDNRDVLELAAMVPAGTPVQIWP
jgi:lipoprotein-anchoring transpeptidase ErfK/SrfK